jgi:ACS family D-galactonate transporter-like MFS transporter
VATSLAGGVSASLSGWLLHVGGSYKLPMMAIFGFLVLGAVNTVVLLQRKWAPKIGVEAPGGNGIREGAPTGALTTRAPGARFIFK